MCFIFMSQTQEAVSDRALALHAKDFVLESRRRHIYMYVTKSDSDSSTGKSSTTGPWSMTIYNTRTKHD